MPDFAPTVQVGFKQSLHSKGRHSIDVDWWLVNGHLSFGEFVQSTSTCA